MSKILNPEPKVIAFLCKWCSSNAADLAGVSRMKYPDNIITIETPCSGRIDPNYIFDSLVEGADGVIVAGCHPGDCHYVVGNYKTLKRMYLVMALAKQLGIEEERIRLEWISSAEAKKFVTVMSEFIEKLKHLPPNPLKPEGLIQEVKH
ncbi:MAG: hydrogenase iron-sulfur subunit [Candidatus Heimdallarchaeota archaeon]|jgi:F420-non-reducing hydrogenase iron-sulfur subunit|nr:hydrogenase iron-sulfur subunit [Candidatus Heimdallarchaeota archaeon]MBY8993439.1 hydrogenase iron-sulfur subunit [Candidatus Heimdallarchaeota archaeon]